MVYFLNGRLERCNTATRQMIFFGSSLFCMGNSISLLSSEADYMRGMLNVERP